MEAGYESKHEQSDGPVQLRAGPDGRFDQPPGRSGGAGAWTCDRDATSPDMRSAAGPDRSSSRSAGGLGTRLELAARYLRLAGAVGRSARLAQRHADRTRGNALQSVQIELDRAKRAQPGARRGRTLARARRRRAGTQRIALQAGSVIEKRASYGERVAGPGAWRGMSTRDIEAYLRGQDAEFWMQVLSEPDGSSGRVMPHRPGGRAPTLVDRAGVLALFLPRGPDRGTGKA